MSFASPRTRPLRKLPSLETVDEARDDRMSELDYELYQPLDYTTPLGDHEVYQPSTTPYATLGPHEVYQSARSASMPAVGSTLHRGPARRSLILTPIFDDSQRRTNRVTVEDDGDPDADYNAVSVAGIGAWSAESGENEESATNGTAVFGKEPPSGAALALHGLTRPRLAVSGVIKTPREGRSTPQGEFRRNREQARMQAALMGVSSKVVDGSEAHFSNLSTRCKLVAILSVGLLLLTGTVLGGLLGAHVL